PPNAGKSTLANRLAGTAGSLVSDRPGTTLDCVARETAIHGIAVSLIDTPGRDDAADELVRLASARATQRLAEADVNLRVHDGSVPPPRQISDAPEGEVPELLVLNKSDLKCVWTPEDIAAHSDGNAIRASAALGTGMEELRSEIIRVLNLEWADEQAVGLFSTRQERIARAMLSRIDDADWPEAWIDQLIGGSESGSSAVARL
ncbi:MAG: GTP-binding protein, partial [bacterium]|nr:GTP-binding protein [bacterium]